VAEHALALTMALNRHLHTANVRMRIGNYALSGLVRRAGPGDTAQHQDTPQPS
jgi:lactate dehydrogenase-like 2-hydroxyacid dehydrogenase